MEQRSPEWFEARLGKATASKISDIIAKTRNGWGVSRKNYAAQLVAERLSGQAADSFTNAAMQWGADTEPMAREAYERAQLVSVTEVGFLDHPVVDMSGASPDGLVGDDGLVEIKCPNTATHIDTLQGSAIPTKYFAQMQWQMACCERDWCDFASFDPRLPLELQLHIRRVERDSKWLAETEEMVAEFLAEVAGTVEQLTAMMNKEAA
ncbi:MAG: lambda exonuclease family protein [Pseudomonadota bacterium]